MTDRITQCDVVDCCEDCPRYVDDCDGDKYLDRYPTMHEYAEGKRINPKLTDQISRADAIEAVASITMSIHLSDVICDKLLALPSADAVSEDTQTEEQARFVAKETELAHIEARLENAEKRLQGVCVANFVAEQLDRLRNMTDEERWDFFIRFFRPSADAVYGKWLPIEETIPTYDGGEKTWITGMKCSNCGKLLDLRVGYYYCPNCGARMKGGAE